MISEKIKSQLSGWGVLVVLCVAGLIALFWIILTLNDTPQGGGWMVGLIVSILFVALCVFLGTGLYTIEPNEAAVLLLFGKYIGTDKAAGFHWANPLYTRKKVSLRARNFDSGKLKVNDKKGNPIEISAIIVWKVSDTAQAIFDVDDYVNFVHVQSESAVRHLATQYCYDDNDGGSVSLRSSIDEVSISLGREIQERVGAAGVIIEEARINHLAYAPEIASAMLQRQQADAIIAARQKIVDGAVGMVHLALEKMQEQEVVELDEERKANMISNLMVVLCADKAPQPIINAGTLY